MKRKEEARLALKRQSYTRNVAKMHPNTSGTHPNVPNGKMRLMTQISRGMILIASLRMIPMKRSPL
jgi:hypothetical protein